jgi:acyl carrier protein
MVQRHTEPHTRAEIRERLRKLVARECDVDPDSLLPETEISRLGADSIHAVELTMAIEDEFDIEVRDEDLDRLHTFEEVAAYLADRLAL